MKTTLSELSAVINTITGTEIAVIEAADTVTVQELCNDSLEWIELVIAIEEKFDVEINDDEVDKLAADQVTVRGLVNYLNQKRGLDDAEEEVGEAGTGSEGVAAEA